jgi:hypothetical protein
MRIIATILSFYILILTAIPCIDVPHNHALHETEQTELPNDNHQDDINHCSPFCTCTCCASPIIYQAFAVILQSFLFANEVHSEYKSSFLPTINISIWQPPKLC